MIKFILISFSVLCFFSCNEEDIDDEIIEQPITQSAPVTQLATDTIDACELCQMDITIGEMHNKVSALFKNPGRQVEMKQLKKQVDSLDQLYSKLLGKYNNDVTRVQAECSKKYNLEFEKDTSKRNALFAAFFVWYHNTSFPNFDTTGYVPIIKNGKYEVYDKGKTVLMNKQQHDAYIAKGLKIKTKTSAIFDQETHLLASKITGIPEKEIDLLCLYVLGYLSRMYQLHPTVNIIKESNMAYIEYMKLQQSQWE